MKNEPADYLQKLIGYFEVHSVEGIIECFENGVDPNAEVDGKPLFFELVNMYLRSPNFKNCVKAFVDYGLVFDDKALLAVLMDDAPLLKNQLNSNSEFITKKYTLDCTFTPLLNVSLLHICAEYNHINCAKILIENGANINEKAGLESHGFGGQSPIFHTVNHHNNNSLEMLNYLLLLQADLSITVQGLIWGKGHDWETYIPSVNPASYAMMGLLPQFQRNERQIYEVVNILQKARYDLDYLPPNIPNKYLYG